LRDKSWASSHNTNKFQGPKTLQNHGTILAKAVDKRSIKRGSKFPKKKDLGFKRERYGARI
jgi:hypothetical protein